MSHEENMKRLNELLAEEIEAGVRYLHLSMTVKGLDRLLIKGVLLENMKETFEHAQMIADRILQLGGAPRLELKLSLPPEKTTAKEAIRTAIAFEQAALDAYRELLEKVECEGNTVLEEFAREQVAVESQHVADLQLLLED